MDDRRRDIVDLYYRASTRIMTGNDATKLLCHFE
jgi:hypothetical protein